MITVDLNSLEGLPDEFLGSLQKMDNLFMTNRFLENLLHNNAIASLIEDINTYCLKNRIIGYHYTRAIPEEIQKAGLSCRAGDDIRNDFLVSFGHYFSEEEKSRIVRAWANYFDTGQKKSRDNCLFFNFTKIALEDFGAEPLLSNFGGEQVYMPLQELKGIGNKLNALGKPLILKCKLTPSNLETFYEDAWGRIALSTYHCKVNKEAHQIDQDGYQYVGVKAEDIELIEYDADNA